MGATTIRSACGGFAGCDSQAPLAGRVFTGFAGSKHVATHSGDSHEAATPAGRRIKTADSHPLAQCLLNSRRNAGAKSILDCVFAYLGSSRVSTDGVRLKSNGGMIVANLVRQFIEG